MCQRRYGGVYADVDFECIRGLDPLVHAIESAGYDSARSRMPWGKSVLFFLLAVPRSSFVELRSFAGIGFFCGVSTVRFFEVNNGLVGACKAHNLLDECIRSIGDGHRAREEGVEGSLATSLMGHGGDTISLTGAVETDTAWERSLVFRLLINYWSTT